MSEEIKMRDDSQEIAVRHRRADRWKEEQEAPGAQTPPAPAEGRKRRGGRAWALPLLYALPFAAAGVFAVARWGADLRDMIQVIIKLAVRG